MPSALRLPTELRLPIPCVCSCNRLHEVAPKGAKAFQSGDEFEGLYWDCECGSSIFFPTDVRIETLSNIQYRPIKRTLAAALACFVLQACEVPAANVSIENNTFNITPPSLAAEPVASPSVEPVAADVPTPSPTPTATATPSPSPSPSPTPHVFLEGKGTLQDPYLLDSPEDVQAIGEHPAAHYEMKRDIRMTGFPFKPIEPTFSGVLYGNNHELYELEIVTTGSTKAALFREVSGTLVQLQLSNVDIRSESYSSAFAGNLTATSLISSCKVSGTLTSPNGGNGYHTGTGRPVYVTKASGARIILTTQQVWFNGNTVNTLAQ